MGRRVRSWGGCFWSNISDREVEEIAAKHVGFPVYLKERKERPEDRDIVFCCYTKNPVIRHETTWVRGEIYDKTGKQVGWEIMEAYLDDTAETIKKKLEDSWAGKFE
jgi:hypothetical protein